GNTFSTLVASTANDGSELVTIPNTPSTTARIKVEAVGNIFFDISNTNFTIGGAAACGNPTGLLSSSITNTSATVSWTAVSGALSYDVDYKATSSGTWINAATATTSTTVGLAGLVQGTTYDWRVRATCSGGSGSYVQAQFTTTAPCNTPAGLASSAITASSATVSWTAVSGANNYTVEYKTTAGSTWTTAASATTSTSQGLSGLSASTSYDWRVRANCASGSSAFAQAQFTTTIASTCPGTYDISTNGTASGAALIPKNTDIKGLISPSGDNDYYRFTIATGGTATITLTTLPADYDIRLYSSNGTTQLAISQNGSTTSETITRTYTAGTYYVRVYGYNNANNATSCYTLRVATGTATRQEDLLVDNKISVFPNPVTRSVNVRIPAVQGMADIKVFDMYGKMVIQKTSGQVNTQLDVSTLPAGIYMVKVMNDGKESTMKIVKE
ncbi:MAG: T9SS type A sorting domain-containing protein, partial [Chitinophagaceae bacterium]